MLRLCSYVSVLMNVLHSFVLPFVCPYAYAASVNQAYMVTKYLIVTGADLIKVKQVKRLR